MLVDVFTRSAEPLTWRVAAAHLVEARHLPSVAPGELRLIRRTVENMARSGELAHLGQVRVDGSRRPMSLYGLRAARASGTSGTEPWELLAVALWKGAVGPDDAD